LKTNLLLEYSRRIVSDIGELIDDCEQVGKDQEAYIRFDDLKRIDADVRKSRTACVPWSMSAAALASWPN
jgi:hypothetical protein